MAIKEGKWKCSFCGAVNLGRHPKCQECKAVRGDDVQFFLDDAAGEVQDENLINTANAGVDWSCDYCQTDNRATDEKCKQCGAARSDGGIDRKEKIILDKANEPQVQAKSKKPAKIKPAAGIAILVGILIIVASLLYFFVFRTSEELLILDSGSWERSIGLEEPQWVTKEAWENDVPRGAQTLSSTTKQSGTKQVQTGTERVKVGTKDKGNGFFEDVFEDKPVYKEEPVYETWVEYRIREWTEYERVEASGTLSDPPVWPAYTLRSGARVGKQSEKATLRFSSSKDKTKKYAYSLKPDLLKDYKTGSKYTGKINALGAVVSLEKN